MLAIWEIDIKMGVLKAGTEDRVSCLEGRMVLFLLKEGRKDRRSKGGREREAEALLGKVAVGWCAGPAWS